MMPRGTRCPATRNVYRRISVARSPWVSSGRLSLGLAHVAPSEKYDAPPALRLEPRIADPSPRRSRRRLKRVLVIGWPLAAGLRPMNARFVESRGRRRRTALDRGSKKKHVSHLDRDPDHASAASLYSIDDPAKSLQWYSYVPSSTRGPVEKLDDGLENWKSGLWNSSESRVFLFGSDQPRQNRLYPDP